MLQTRATWYVSYLYLFEKLHNDKNDQELIGNIWAREYYWPVHVLAIRIRGLFKSQHAVVHKHNMSSLSAILQSTLACLACIARIPIQ